MLDSQDTKTVSSPPLGDRDKADKYIAQLNRLISEDKLDVYHTNLKQFDLNSMQDHYRIDLGEYEVEISHTKQAQSGKDFYIMLFNNLRKIPQGVCQKVILAYIHLDENQFRTFKEAAYNQLERKRKAAEQKRFREAMMPIDSILSNLRGEPASQSLADDHPERQDGLSDIDPLTSLTN